MFGCREIFSNYSFKVSLEAVKGGKKKRSRRKFLLIMSKKENADHFTIQKKNRYMQQGKETADIV